MEYEVLRQVVARRLKSLREKKEWNQRQAEKVSGVSQKTISNAENTDASINLDTLIGLATAYGVEVWEILKPGPEDSYLINDWKGIYEVDPVAKILNSGPSELRKLAADQKVSDTLGITMDEWRLLAAVGNVLPPTVDKAGFVQLLFTLRSICR